MKPKTTKRTPTKADLVYERFRPRLEREHFGEIVAIDPDLEQVVGVGANLSEAYEQAKKKTGKQQFAFKRVGYSHVERILDTHWRVMAAA